MCKRQAEESLERSGDRKKVETPGRDDALSSLPFSPSEGAHVAIVSVSHLVIPVSRTDHHGHHHSVAPFPAQPQNAKANLPSCNLPSSKLPTCKLPSPNLPSSKLQSNLPSSKPPSSKLPTTTPFSTLPSSTPSFKLLCSMPSSRMPSSTPSIVASTVGSAMDTIIRLLKPAKDTDADEAAKSKEGGKSAEAASSGEEFKAIGKELHKEAEDRHSFKYTMQEVSNHCEPDSCWIILWDHVYDVTSFIREHPGGEDIIYEHSGYDATSVFCDVNHSNDALLVMMQYEIGVLVDEERTFKCHKSR